jgi:VWFA-related protein
MLALPSLPLSDSAQQPSAQQPAQQSTPQAAQQPAGNQPMTTLKVQANEVLLPVTVRNKKGELVPDLAAADFTLTEDGRPQTIKSFSHQSDLPFLVGLLVDTSQSVSGALDSERKAAEKFVELMLPADPKNGKQGDKAFLIHFDREVELLEDITNSRSKLDKEIEDMGPSTLERNNPQGPETSSGGNNGGGNNGSNNGGWGGNGGSGGQNGGQQNGRQSRGNALGGTQLYDAIYLASEDVLKSENGRKAVIVFSDGLDRGSKETLSEAVDAAERANVSVYTIYFKGEEQGSMMNNFPGRRGGMGYPGGGYPGGGYPGGYPGGGRTPRNDTGVDGKKIMEQIATRTGGRYFEAKKKDNLEDIYNQIAQELRGQYLLSYTPDQVDNDGGYHKVALKAKKEDLIVVTREGYYAPGGSSR